MIIKFSYGKVQRLKLLSTIYPNESDKADV